MTRRHHDVNIEAVQPARSAAGDAFTDLVVEVAWLGGIFTAIGERLARTADQTLARWVILDAVVDEPATVAHIARRRGIARQAVQRVADLLERDGLAVYEPNPRHRRAKLLRATPRGQEVVRTIAIAQTAWADALGTAIGTTNVRQATALIRDIRRIVSAADSTGEQSTQRRTRRQDAAHQDHVHATQRSGVEET